MTQQNFDRLATLWSSDPRFRAAFRADPDAALFEHGFELSDEERDALDSLDLGKLSDTELERRVSHRAGC